MGVVVIAVQNRPASTLGDLIGQVKEAFEASGRMIPVLIGKHYRTTGVGGPGARVVFEPEKGGGGGVGGPINFGNAGTMIHACTVVVRAAESGDDVERMKAVYTLADVVIGMIQTAGTGRVTWGALEDGSPSDVDGYGAEIVFTFTFTREISHDARRWGLPATAADTSDPRPAPPPGELGTIANLGITMVPPEE